jgi:hypothetical protein
MNSELMERKVENPKRLKNAHIAFIISWIGSVILEGSQFGRSFCLDHPEDQMRIFIRVTHNNVIMITITKDNKKKYSDIGHNEFFTRIIGLIKSGYQLNKRTCTASSPNLVEGETPLERRLHRMSLQL